MSENKRLPTIRLGNTRIKSLFCIAIPIVLGFFVSTGYSQSQNRIKKLNAIEAKGLLGLYGNQLVLALNEIDDITLEAAEILSNFKGANLSLNGLKTITPEVAEYLSNYKGLKLSLDGLKTITLTNRTQKLHQHSIPASRYP